MATEATADNNTHSLPAVLRQHLDTLIQSRRTIPLCFLHNEPFCITAEPMQSDSFREHVPLAALFTGLSLLLSNIRIYLNEQLNRPARTDGFRHAATVYFTDLHLRETEAVLAFRVNTQLVPVYRRQRRKASSDAFE